MTRITKDLANEIAAKLTAPLQVKINDLQLKKQKTVNDYFKSLVPPDVLKCYKKHPSFFRKDSVSVYLADGVGYSNKHVGYYKFEGFPCNNSSNALIDNKDVANEIKELDRSIEAKKRDREESSTVIFNALIGLGTYKRIRESMPEAGKYLLDNPAAFALAVDYSKANNLIKIIQKQNA